jgi:hypothetical protein
MLWVIPKYCPCVCSSEFRQFSVVSQVFTCKLHQLQTYAPLTVFFSTILNRSSALSATRIQRSTIPNTNHIVSLSSPHPKATGSAMNVVIVMAMRAQNVGRAKTWTSAWSASIGGSQKSTLSIQKRATLGGTYTMTLAGCAMDAILEIVIWDLIAVSIPQLGLLYWDLDNNMDKSAR